MCSACPTPRQSPCTSAIARRRSISLFTRWRHDFRRIPHEYARAGRARQNHPGNLRAERLLLIGAGSREEFSLDSIRKVLGSAARFLRSKGARSMAVLRRSQLDIGNSAQAAVEGVLLGLFEPDMYKTENKEERRIDELILVAASAGSEDALAKGVERGRIIGEAVNLARELSNEPSSTLTPATSRVSLRPSLLNDCACSATVRGK